MRLAMLARMAAYNAWANGRLHDACDRLPEAEYRAARPAFFGSIHGTLSHLLVADLIWQARIEGRAPPAGLALDTELHAGRAELRAARTAEDERLVAVVAGLAEAALDRRVAYRTTAGTAHEDALELVLQHRFNHQTHHRGQVHGMLSATPVPPPPLDLIYFAREPQAGRP